MAHLPTSVMLGIGLVLCGAAPAFADCGDLPDHAAVQSALKASVAPAGGPGNGGFDLHMWATLVDRDGTVAEVRVVRSTGSVLDRQALIAVRQWRYAPFMQNGQRERFVLRVMLSFSVAS